MMEENKPTVYESLGRFTYWHLVDPSLRGTIADRSAALLKIVERYDPLPAEKWPRPITQQKVRAMALELAAASAPRGEPCGPDLLHLLAWAMNVPPSFLYDPSELLAGHDGRGQGADPVKKNEAELLDFLHFRKHGKYMSINALANAVGASPPSVREWAKGWRADGEWTNSEPEPLTGRSQEVVRAAVRDWTRDNLAKFSPRFQRAYNQLQKARPVVAARLARLGRTPWRK